MQKAPFPGAADAIAGTKRISRNVYAHTREECEEKLAVMIEEMKKEMAAEKEKLKTKIGNVG